MKDLTMTSDKTAACYCLFELIYGRYPEESMCKSHENCEGCPYADKGQA